MIEESGIFMSALNIFVAN